MIYVLSVPHTGSRTLLKHLGIDSWEDHVQNGGLLHFGYDDQRIKLLPKGPVAIPVRNPIATLQSWYSRRLSLDRGVSRCMARLVSYTNLYAEYFPVERLEGRIGASSRRLREARKAAETAWERLKTPEIEAFYGQYYALD